jgi:hypothetical protein
VGVEGFKRASTTAKPYQPLISELQLSGINLVSTKTRWSRLRPDQSSVSLSAFLSTDQVISARKDSVSSAAESALHAFGLLKYVAAYEMATMFIFPRTSSCGGGALFDLVYGPGGCRACRRGTERRTTKLRRLLTASDWAINPNCHIRCSERCNRQSGQHAQAAAYRRK